MMILKEYLTIQYSVTNQDGNNLSLTWVWEAPEAGGQLL